MPAQALVAGKSDDNSGNDIGICLFSRLGREVEGYKGCSVGSGELRGNNNSGDDVSICLLSRLGREAEGRKGCRRGGDTEEQSSTIVL